MRLLARNFKQDASFRAMRESFQEILHFWKNWETLSEQGKQTRLQSIIDKITVTKEHIDIDLIVGENNLKELTKESHLVSGLC